MGRLTKWEGINVDGTPRAVLVQREGLFCDILQPALVKLAQYEDWEELMAISMKISNDMEDSNE